jgi:TPR repeat protein
LVQALELLSNIETSQGNHTAALHFLLEAREKSAVKHPHIDTKIGKRYYYGHGVAQSLSKALHYFNAAIATAPDACADPYYYLALIYGRGCQKFNKNERRAIEFVEKALTMPCTNEMRATMLLKRAQLFFKGSCKNHARAIEDLNHALKQSPGSVLTSKIHHLLGVLYQQKNSIYANATLARKALKKVNGTTPAEHLDSLYRLRDLYSNTTMEGLSLEDQKKALDTIENGIKKHPMNPCVVIERFEQTDHKRKPTDSLIQNRSKRLKQTTLRKDASQLALDFTTAPTHGIATMDQSAHDQS